MLIDSLQARKLLGFKSLHPIKKLIKEGKLKDYGVTKEGNSRHEIRLNLQEVKTFIREMKENGKIINRKEPFYNHTTRTYRNPSPIVEPVISPNGILTKLERIETKLDQLLKIWS